MDGVTTWWKVAGFGKGPGVWAERQLGLGERARGIRKLLSVVERMIGQAFRASVPAEELAERTFQWDPLYGVLHRLGLARNKLTAFAREFLGLNAAEICDRVRARGVEKAMRSKLTAWFREQYGMPGFWDHNSSRRRTARQWAFAAHYALRETRRTPEWSRVTWAAEYGFANYARFQRGCVLACGKTPQQLEFSILLELAEYWAAAQSLGRFLFQSSPEGSYTVLGKPADPPEAWRVLSAEKRAAGLAAHGIVAWAEAAAREVQDVQKIS